MFSSKSVDSLNSPRLKSQFELGVLFCNQFGPWVEYRQKTIRVFSGTAQPTQLYRTIQMDITRNTVFTQSTTSKLIIIER